MMNTLKIILITIILTGFSQDLRSEDMDKTFIGKWSNDKDPIGYINFLPDNTYEKFVSRDVVIKGTWSFENNDLTIKFNSEYNNQTAQQEIKYFNVQVIDDVLVYKTLENDEVKMQKRSKTEINGIDQ